MSLDGKYVEGGAVLPRFTTAYQKLETYSAL